MALNKQLLPALGVVAMFIGSTAQASTAQIQVTFENNATANGTILTPAWVGFHDGSFDTFTTGEAATQGLERLAEDGNTAVLTTEFNNSAAGMGGGVTGTIAGAVGPGGMSSDIFDVNTDGSNNYFSYASMLLPSSDFFIGNGAPASHDLSGLLANVGSSITFDVFRVYDAGTEVNDFGTAPTPPNTARGIAGGQTGPDQGVDEGGFVTFVGSANEVMPSLSGLIAFGNFQPDVSDLYHLFFQ